MISPPFEGMSNSDVPGESPLPAVLVTLSVPDRRTAQLLDTEEGRALVFVEMLAYITALAACDPQEDGPRYAQVAIDAKLLPMALGEQRVKEILVDATLRELAKPIFDDDKEPWG